MEIKYKDNSESNNTITEVYEGKIDKDYNPLNK